MAKRKDAPVTAQDQVLSTIREILENSDADTVTIPDLRDRVIRKLGAPALNAWLDEQLPTLLAGLIREQIGMYRAHARQSARSQVFGSEVTGLPMDETDFDIFQVRYNLGNGERKYVALGAMRKGDHLALAEDYENRGERALLRSALHQELARRCGNKRTDEVFNAEELLTLMGKHEYDPLIEAQRDRAA